MMMQLCGQCAQQVAQTGAVLAPALWWLAAATVTVILAKTGGGKKKGKGK